MRDILLIIHILAASAWIGAAAVQFAIVPRLVRPGGEPAKAWMDTVVHLGRTYFTPAAILVLASGVWLVLNSSLYEFEHFFVVLGVVTVLVGGGLGGGLYAPKARDAARAFAAGDVAAGNAAAATISKGAVVEFALLVTTVAAMVYRWGA